MGGSLATEKSDAIFQMPSQPTPAFPSDAGDFTKEFQTVSEARENGVGPAKAVAEPAPNRKAQPGEFTNRFATSEEPSPRVVGPERPLFENSVSETKDFRSQKSPQRGFPDRPSEEDSQPAFPPVWTPVSKEPDLFPHGNLSSKPAVDSGLHSTSHLANESATQVFRTQDPKPDVTHVQAEGPSEYTQAVRVSAGVPEPTKAEVSVPEPQAAAEPLAGKPSSTPPPEKTSPPPYLLLILIMNALFLAAVVLVVYFVLKK